MTLILLAVAPLVFSGALLVIKASDVNGAKRLAQENSSKVAVEAIANIKTVKALNLTDHFIRRYHTKLLAPQARLEKKYFVSSLGVGYSDGVIYFIYLIGFYLGYLFIKKGEIEFQNMFRVLLAIIFTTAGAGRISTIAPDLNKATEAFAQVLKIIDRQPKIDASSPEGYIGKEEEEEEDKEGKMEEAKDYIEFRQLQFSYPSRPSVMVLRMANGSTISIPKGKQLALVGGSGCGKSTLIGLLPRWYDPSRGDILVAGRRNVDYNLRWLRRQMGMVNQEPSLFHISIRENIRYGKEEASDEEVVEAAKKANIHTFIQSLPEGYDTIVGGMGTSTMSGGQKQRIAIARALIRQPKLLLLDEATSALDAESEFLVQQALEAASHSQGRTTITIAHRLSTVRTADKIVVMKEGSVAEMGTHDELMAKKGEYYQMVMAGNS